ncbi:MAG: hypothetical protein EA422_09975 [Gemmatimonadales bacterium]|nr:MAG: hypothetical protein EA422_09975 [Gemmatimonadales bacterium]
MGTVCLALLGLLLATPLGAAFPGVSAVPHVPVGAVAPDIPAASVEQTASGGSRDPGVAPGQSGPESPVEIRLETFPARSVPPGGIMLPVEGREVTLGPRQADGRWPVVDRFRLRNDSTATWVAGDDGPVVWQFPLPSGAVAMRYVEGDPASDAVFFQGTGVQVVGPLRPGATVLTLTYELPSLEFRLPLPGVTEALAVRTARGLPLLSVEGLDGPFHMEGDAAWEQLPPGAGGIRPDGGPIGAAREGFTVWTGADLRNRILHVAPSADVGSPPWVAWLLGLVLVGVGILVFLRRRVSEAAPKSDA